MTPLHGIRILDLSRVLAGPWATQLLADFGADVIKVERPGTGDDTRAWGPPWLPGETTLESSYYASTNRNKRSITVDFTEPAGLEVVRALAARSDVVVENFKTGGLKAYGLDYETLSRDHPGLVYCSVTGFGQTGPSATRAGYDLLIQATGGMMSVSGRPDGEPGEGPLKVGVAVVDILTGMYAANAIQAALLERTRSGLGQHIDLALFDASIAALGNQSHGTLVTGRAPKRMGNAHPTVVPYQDFKAKNGRVIIAVGNDRQFAELVKVLGAPELGTDPRYIKNAGRVVNRETLLPRLEELLQTRTAAEWVALLEPKSVPCGEIRDLAQVFADPEVQERQIGRTMHRKSGEEVPVVSNPVRFSRTPIEYRHPPPRLGEDTEEILRELRDASDDEKKKKKKK